MNGSILLLYAIPGKTASRFAWENRFALFLELLLPHPALSSSG
ncbi:UNVERIFIED_ORG: hypothetical protein M2435_006633 [Rhizobium sophorae]|jgi:hypothetical protein|uniref:Uncharacterized protein n=1 Tax=Rhizobium leguminosarum TaxID=384 RepID=A0A2Z4YW81_RHILE|nr:hypothetical protein DLJ82_6845 [Rhizobium leguminosarum]MBA9034499.1 hypothetical protein [Rhizobium leguminosarum]MBB4526562.1 hypothetical protein [Rhizobium leguminosarum]MDH6663687.1 hypothetical protein [Rhizobium sophorae]